MPESSNADSTSSLSQRFDALCEIVEDVVLRGIEHPACELKRNVTVSRENLADRLDFVKFIQGVANSHSDSECLIVIGADQTERAFFDVTNAQDFDPARLSPILAKYLAPEPIYEIFHNMQASTGERYVLIVMNRMQPRPIMTLVDGKTEVKTYFRPGDICIKHNTGLRPATKADLDLMYEPRIAAEAQKRARIIFEHMKADLGPELLSQAVRSTPAPELLLGSRERLARFAEAMISGVETARFDMLLEMARQIIIEESTSSLQRNLDYYGSDTVQTSLSDFYRIKYLPTLISVVDLGLQVVRFSAPLAWFERVIDLLVEAFPIAGQIGRGLNVGVPDSPTVPLGRPAYELYLGVRTLATYCIARQRTSYMGSLISRYVKPIAPEPRYDFQEPFLFWPFAGQLGLPEMLGGRNVDLWHQGIGAIWGQAFGSTDNFLSAAAQLEFVLELNSHLLLQYPSPATQRFRTEYPRKRTAYLPDFWNSSLDPAIPMATYIFEALMGSTGFPLELAVEPTVTSEVFVGMSVRNRELFYGAFLSALEAWQEEVMLQQRRSPYYLNWPTQLQRIIDSNVPPR